MKRYTTDTTGAEEQRRKDVSKASWTSETHTHTHTCPHTCGQNRPPNSCWWCPDAAVRPGLSSNKWRENHKELLYIRHFISSLNSNTELYIHCSSLLFHYITRAFFSFFLFFSPTLTEGCCVKDIISSKWDAKTKSSASASGSKLMFTNDLNLF